jgi:hypothetical protein
MPFQVLPDAAGRFVNCRKKRTFRIFPERSNQTPQTNTSPEKETGEFTNP